ncbi:MAG: GTPase Era [Bacteroidetes bacterium]|nr:GTPase Era [Bacteroidota bacterium]
MGTTEKHCGYVAIIGRPNAGKSTLLNQLLEFKLSIVSPKPQTTRQKVLGILNEPDAQIIFLDTPGLIKPRYALQSAMMKIADGAIQSSDVIALIVDVTDKDHRAFVDELLKTNLKKTEAPILLLLNKVDRIAKPELLPLLESYHKTGLFRELIPISALKNDGVDRVKRALIGLLPVSEPFYPDDILTEQPERFFVAEIIREKIFYQFAEEIPYSTDVVIEEFKERSAGKTYIRAVVLVERDSQKAILVGKKGEASKQLGQAARVAMEEFLDRPVFLEIWVKVREDWRSDTRALRDLGYTP